MKEINPKVSIVIPVYNGSDYLKEAIDSALAQTYTNIEILVVNDGSTDNGKTEEIALSYGEKIKYYYKENGGVASALNFGIKKMQGEYFSWLSHDDVYKENKIEIQIKKAKKNSETVIVYSDFVYIDKDSKFLFESGLNKTKIENFNSMSFKYELLVEHFVNGCTLLIPKMCFEKVGLFSENLKTSQDYEMWFRLSMHYDFYFIKEPLVYSRIHEQQGTYRLEEFDIEKNEFYINCLKKLSQESLQEMSEESSLELIYLNLALIYKNKGLLGAANYSFNLCKEVFLKEEGKGIIEINPFLIQQQLKSISSLIRDKKVILFGTGRGAKMVLKELQNSFTDVEFFVDNDPQKWGSFFELYPIHEPSYLIKREKDFVILIASMYFKEISTQLTKMGFIQGIDFFPAATIIK